MIGDCHVAAIDAMCDAQERVIQRVIASGAAIEEIYFPRKTRGVPGRTVLALVVLAQQQPDSAAPRHLAKRRR